MLGAITGDIIGSPWESAGYKRTDFPLFSEYSRFTDDTVMALAVAKVLLDGDEYADSLRAFGRRHPFAGYGARFEQWLLDPSMGPYQSYGNGGAMRASPIGFAARSATEAVEEAARCAVPTHDHPEGIKGAQAVAMSVYMARNGASKAALRAEISTRFGYDLARTVESIRPHYSFDVAAERSVPEAIICFLDAEDFESTIRNAVSLGGDADTMASISGAIADAFWGGVPEPIATEALARLPEDLRALLARFRARFGC